MTETGETHTIGGASSANAYHPLRLPSITLPPRGPHRPGAESALWLRSSGPETATGISRPRLLQIEADGGQSI